MKRLFVTPFNADLAILLLRLVFGGMFVSFGYMKLASYDAILPMLRATWV